MTPISAVPLEKFSCVLLRLFLQRIGQAQPGPYRLARIRRAPDEFAVLAQRLFLQARAEQAIRHPEPGRRRQRRAFADGVERKNEIFFAFLRAHSPAFSMVCKKNRR